MNFPDDSVICDQSERGKCIYHILHQTERHYIVKSYMFDAFGDPFYQMIEPISKKYADSKCTELTKDDADKYRSTKENDSEDDSLG